MEQYGFLRSLGCLQGQGFLWSPAVPIDKLADALASSDQVPVAASRSSMARASTAHDAQVTALISKMSTERAPLHTMARALNRVIGSTGRRWTAGSVARELPAASSRAWTWGHGSAPLVLLCNDVEPARRMLRVDLELAGFEVEEASDGRAAMARLIEADARDFSVIVLDAQVAHYDGRWALAAIRAYRRLDDVPVLLVTDPAASDRVSDKVKAGLDVVISGPVGADRLVEAVERLVAASRSTCQCGSPVG